MERQRESLKPLSQSYSKEDHTTREERRRHLYAFVRHYNHVRPHQELKKLSPITHLENFIRESKKASKNNAQIENV